MSKGPLGFTSPTSDDYEVSDNNLDVIPLSTEMPDYSDEFSEGYAEDY